MHRKILLHEITIKLKPPHVNGYYEDVFLKRKARNLCINNKYLHIGNRNEILDWEMCNSDNEKVKNTNNRKKRTIKSRNPLNT